MAYVYSREQATSFSALNPTKTNSYTVSQPTRDEEGKTETDRIIERNKAARDSNVFTGLPQSVLLTPEEQIQTIKDQQGNVIGITDPVTRQTTVISPTDEARIRDIEQKRASAIITAQQQAAATSGTGGGSSSTTTTQTDVEKAVQKAVEEGRIVTAAQPKTKVQQVKESFLEGTRRGSLIGRGIDYFFRGEIKENPFTYNYGQGAAGKAGTLGAAFGFIGDTALLTGGGGLSYFGSGKAAQAGQKVQGGINQGLRTLTGGVLPATVTNIVGGSAVGYATFKATKKAVSERINVGQNKEFKDIPSKRTDIEKEMFAYGRQAEGKSFNTNDKLISETFTGKIMDLTMPSRVIGRAAKKYAGQAGFTIGISGRENVFEQAAYDYLAFKEVPESQRYALVERGKDRRVTTQAAVLAATFNIGAFSERTGQIATSTKLGKGATPNFKTFFSTIAPAGAGEGFAQTIITQENLGDTRKFFTDKTQRSLFDIIPVPPALIQQNPERYEKAKELTGFKTTRFGEAVLGGGLGATTAGVLGGAIGAAGAKGQTGKKTALETLGYILDPSEKPSDILEGLVQGQSSRVPVFTPVPSLTATTTPVSSLTETPAKPKGKAVSLTSSNNNAFVNIDSFTNSLVGTQSTTMTTVPADDFIIDITPFTETPADVPSDVPSDTPADVPVDVLTEVPTEVPADVLTEVPADVFTNVPANVPVSVPVFTNKIGAGLPILPSFNFGGQGYAGAGRKKRSKFVDELTLSTNLFKGSFLGFSSKPLSKPLTPPKQKKAKTKSKQKKTKSKARKTSRRAASSNKGQRNDFFKLAFG